MKRLDNIPHYDRHWLIPKEALLAYNLMRLFDVKDRTFLEVGVLGGAWSLNLLRNFSVIKGIGIDPYPNLKQLRNQLLEDVKMYDYKLYSSFEDLIDLQFELSIVHIDGEHSENAVLADIKKGLDLLRGDGIIIVDDYLHPYFPGVASALYTAINKFDLAPFLNTGSKCYLCRSSLYEHYYDIVEKLLESQSEVPWARFWGEGSRNPYISYPDVRSFRPILSPEYYLIKESNKLIPYWPDQPDQRKPQESC